LIEACRRSVYVDGKTVKESIPVRRRQSERLPARAAKLVQINPILIFAYGGARAAAKQATESIPIVVLGSTIRSGGTGGERGTPRRNVTGITTIYDELAGNARVMKERCRKFRAWRCCGIQSRRS